MNSLTEKQKIAKKELETLKTLDTGLFSFNGIRNLIEDSIATEIKLKRYLELVFQEDFTPDESNELFELNTFFKKRYFYEPENN